MLVPAHLDDKIWAVGAVFVGSCAWAPFVRPEVQLPPEDGQGRQACLCLHPHVAPMAAVAAGRATCRNDKARGP